MWIQGSLISMLVKLTELAPERMFRVAISLPDELPLKHLSAPTDYTHCKALKLSLDCWKNSYLLPTKLGLHTCNLGMTKTLIYPQIPSVPHLASLTHHAHHILSSCHTKRAHLQEGQQQCPPVYPQKGREVPRSEEIKNGTRW